MKTFNELKQNAKKDFSKFSKVKVALLGDSSTQFLVHALRGAGYEYCLNLEIWEADYNQIETNVFDQESELYRFCPEVVIIFHSSAMLLRKFNQKRPESYPLFADDHMENLQQLFARLIGTLNAKIIYYNFNEINDAVFGNFGNKSSSSFLFQLRKINYEIMQFSALNGQFFVCDLSTIQNDAGRRSFFHPSIYIQTDMVLSLDVLPAVAYRTNDLISAMQGVVKKCIVLDLDNTIWGGIIGDDGIENIQIGSLGIGKAFTEFQYWVKKLKNRGVIVCVCSKNTEDVAKEPFLKHPDMVLRLDDISVFVANWENKVDNLHYIQQVLNIGFDSMVFLDDNPFERTMVREQIAGITVPELPEDPANYLEILYNLNLFETISFSEEDTKRTDLYKSDAERKMLKEHFGNEQEYLKSMGMTSKVEPFNKFNIPRVAQLSQRSNQFNLRTMRYTEGDIVALSNSEKHFSFTFTLDDRFGSNGLVCVVLLMKEDADTVFIDSLFMSCRVLKRTMENFVLNILVSAMKDKGFRYFKGEYIATHKNVLVQNLYQGLGFIEKMGYWYLSVNDYVQKETYITSEQQQKHIT